MLGECDVSLVVLVLSACVVAAVEFDDEHRFAAGKVDDVWADGVLASEAEAVESAGAELGPEDGFGWGLCLAE